MRFKVPILTLLVAPLTSCTTTPKGVVSAAANRPKRHESLRKYMTDALKYWVREADIDGYGCDVAPDSSLDFWNNARRELDAILVEVACAKTMVVGEVCYCSQERKLLAAESKKRPMHSQQLARGLVIDETGFLEPVHEKGNARTGRPYHLGQRLMTHLRNRSLGCSMAIEVGELQKNMR